jgi:cytochrome c oxidase cbb3-type subunit 2
MRRRPALPALAALVLLACRPPPPATRGLPPEATALVRSWLAGAEPDGAAASRRPPVDTGLRALGAEAYRLRCTPCHGVNGNGRGPHALRLSIPPRDFTSGVYELRSTPSGTLPVDEDLFRAVSRGLHGTAMLPWAWLPEPERWAVVEHVKSFSRRFREEAPGDAVTVPSAPPESPALAARGPAAYAAAGCASCHGPSGAGDGPSVPSLRRDGGGPVRPRPFSDRRFNRGSGLAEIWLTLQTGLDGTPMPSYAAVPPDELWAIAAHVRTLAGPGSPPPAPDPEEELGYRIDILGE